jgi:pseudouridine synthase
LGSRERLNHFLARTAGWSRREADRRVAAGDVLVNGERPPPSGLFITSDDQVTVGGRMLRSPRHHTYVVMNKPVGVVVTASDPQRRRTVFDLLPKSRFRGRLFYAGRLDYDTSGLVLLTDDGELAQRLAHPRYKVAKEYVATVTGQPDEAALARLRLGVQLEDGITQPAEVRLLRHTPRQSRLRLRIYEGRNRQIRRMLAAVGHPVVDLTRTRLGPLTLGDVAIGGWRRLSQTEASQLRAAVGLPAR